MRRIVMNTMTLAKNSAAARNSGARRPIGQRLGPTSCLNTRRLHPGAGGEPVHLAVVCQVCERIAVMYLGGIVEIARRDELYK
jgi:hypothetical protein